ncbi:hypothetical protein HDU67_001627 [Dinochytrium kinnereticum]|nr:hypothetical protein HDU67_001627 [Dinochytrium kinnereticum]
MKHTKGHIRRLKEAGEECSLSESDALDVYIEPQPPKPKVKKTRRMSSEVTTLVLEPPQTPVITTVPVWDHSPPTASPEEIASDYEPMPNHDGEDGMRNEESVKDGEEADDEGKKDGEEEDDDEEPGPLPQEPHPFAPAWQSVFSQPDPRLPFHHPAAAAHAAAYMGADLSTYYKPPGFPDMMPFAYPPPRWPSPYPPMSSNPMLMPPWLMGYPLPADHQRRIAQQFTPGFDYEAAAAEYAAAAAAAMPMHPYFYGPALPYPAPYPNQFGMHQAPGPAPQSSTSSPASSSSPSNQPAFSAHHLAQHQHHAAIIAGMAGQLPSMMNPAMARYPLFRHPTPRPQNAPAFQRVPLTPISPGPITGRLGKTINLRMPPPLKPISTSPKDGSALTIPPIASAPATPRPVGSLVEKAGSWEVRGNEVDPGRVVDIPTTVLNDIRTGAPAGVMGSRGALVDFLVASCGNPERVGDDDGIDEDDSGEMSRSSSASSTSFNYDRGVVALPQSHLYGDGGVTVVPSAIGSGGPSFFVDRGGNRS